MIPIFFEPIPLKSVNILTKFNITVASRILDGFQKVRKFWNSKKFLFRSILSKKLGKHDLGNLGSKKPSLVERIINNASAKVGRCFELESGAKLTEKEKNAKTGKAFNSECPWLFNDLVAP